MRVNTTLSNGAQGVLTIVLQGTQFNGGDDAGQLSINSSQVTLGTSGAALLYKGQVTGLRTRYSGWRISALVSKNGSSASQVQLQIALSISSSGQVNGTVRGMPTQGQSVPTSTNTSDMQE